MDSIGIFCTVALLACGLYWFVCLLGKPEQKKKRVDYLSDGSISAEKVRDNYNEYWSFVDNFYNQVNYFYEWGWGESFHLYPPIKGKSDHESARLHEEMAADLIEVKPGDRILDVGCGIGGPMRAIAAHSRANVVGININEYQVNRARQYNKKARLDSLCEVVQGNFLEMPFKDNTFDGAYAIEATGYAPKLEDVYAEVFRVMKPGSLYVSYEMVTTDKYRGDNPEHVEIIQGIARACSLPGVRSYKDIAEVAKRVGFEVVKEKDLAKPPALPWWDNFRVGRLGYWKKRIPVTVLTAIGIAPKGTVDVLDMLFKTTGYWTRAGDYGIYSTMHMILLRKPQAPPSKS